VLTLPFAGFRLILGAKPPICHRKTAAACDRLWLLNRNNWWKHLDASEECPGRVRLVEGEGRMQKPHGTTKTTVHRSAGCRKAKATEGASMGRLQAFKVNACDLGNGREYLWSTDTGTQRVHRA